MEMLRKILGNILYGIGKIISVVLDIIIGVTDFIVSFVVSVGRGILGLISAGGCLFFFLLGPSLLFNPAILLIISMLIIIPFLGTKFVSFLKYAKYIVTEYLFDRARYLKEGKKGKYKSFNEYGNKYRRMEEEKWRKEQERRQEEQQKQWEEKFRQWHEYQNTQNTGGYSYGGYQQGQTYYNPTDEFKKKYEESCDLLGLDYDTDIYKVKLAYRKKAKENHPDLNKSPDATKIFQKINDAYEFLSEGNIERYKKMK
jgi:hypothetical protein